MGILISIVNESLMALKGPIDAQRLLQINDELKKKVSHESFKQSRIIIIRFLFYYANKVGLNKKQTITFIAICFRKLSQFYKTAKLYPDVPAVLDRLKKDGYTLGIVTTASRKNIKQLLPDSYSQYFDCIITREMVTRLKPSPEGLYRALVKLQRKPKESIYIGDLPHDIMAGHNANMQVIALESSLISKEILEQYNPDKVCSNLSEAAEWIIEYNKAP